MPLKAAIVGLLDASSRTDEEWAAFLGCRPWEIKAWRRVDANFFPTDEQMSTMLADLERIKGSRDCPNLPKALNAFWDVIETCESNGTNVFMELHWEEGATLAQRFTRFTLGRKVLEAHWRNIHLIPLRHRAAFFNELQELFSKYAEE